MFKKQFFKKLRNYTIGIISFQQFFFGKISFELKILFLICAVIGILFILFPSLIVCLLEREMKIHRKKLIKLQFNSFLN